MNVKRKAVSALHENTGLVNTCIIARIVYLRCTFEQIPRLFDKKKKNCAASSRIDLFFQLRKLFPSNITSPWVLKYNLYSVEFFPIIRFSSMVTEY